MAFLVSATLIVGLLCLMDLLLTLGVIRRLRQHTARLDGLDGRLLGDAQLGAGDTVGTFTATTTEGEPISRDVFDRETVVAFMAPDCDVCHERMPQFIARARTLPGGRRQALAIVLGEPPVAASMVASLGEVARVVCVVDDDSVIRAFKISMFPSFFVVTAGGKIVVADLDPVRALAAIHG